MSPIDTCGDVCDCQSEQKEQYRYRYIVRLSPVPGHWHPHGATVGWGGDNGAMRADTRQ